MRSIAELIVHLELNGLALWAEGDQIRYRGAPEFLEHPDFMELKNRKTEAIEFLRVMRPTAGLPPLMPHPRPDRIVASQSQIMAHALSHQHHLAPRQISMGFRLWNGPQAEVRSRAINAVADRHEVLRTIFRSDSQGLQQVILPKVEVPVHVENLASVDPGSRRAYLFRERLPEYRRQTVDDATCPALRLGLFILSDDEVFLSLDGSRLAIDRYSWQLIVREMTIFTRAYRAKTRAMLRWPGLQYADFALWERKLIDDRGPDLSAYWSAALEKTPLLRLSSEISEPPPYRKDSIVARPSSDISIAVKALATKSGLPSSTIISTGILWSIGRLAGQEAIALGLHINQRVAAMHDMIGPCSRLVPLIVDFTGAASFAEAIQRTLTAILVAQNPLHLLSPETVVEHRLNRIVLSVVMRKDTGERVTLEDVEDDGEDASLANTGRQPVSIPTFYNDLAITIVESESRSSVRFDFAPAKIRRETVQHLVTNLLRFLEKACADPLQPASSLSVEQPG